MFTSKLFRVVLVSMFVGAIVCIPHVSLGAAPPGPSWSKTVSGSHLSKTAGFPYAGSAVGDLFGDGRQVVVAGFPNGQVWAWFASNGATVPGWPINAGDAVHSAPTLHDLNNDGDLEVIITTEGRMPADSFSGPARGWIYVLNPDGSWVPGWPQRTLRGGPTTGFPEGFFGSATVGDLWGNGSKQIVAGGWDHYLYVWNTDGSLAPGFPIFLWDTIWDSPTLVDLDRNGQLDIVIGSDSSGPEWGEPYPAGGVYWAFRPDGTLHAGWPKLTDQVPWASTAAADLESDGIVDVVAGSGFYFDASRGKQVNVWRSNGANLSGWPRATGGRNFGSPAVGDLLKNGKRQVVQASEDGKIYAFNHDGSNLPGWPINPGLGSLHSSAVIAPVDGSGYNGVWVAAGNHLLGYSRTGTKVFDVTLSGLAVAAPSVAKVGSQLRVFVTACGSSDVNRCVSDSSWNFYAFDIPGASSMATGAWPTFHGNIGRTGSNLAPVSKPPGGYWFVAGDGGIFTHGDAAFYGSTGGMRLKAPVVGMGAPRDGRGYWLVASDGGIFTFGRLGFYGSTGAMTLDKPVVGMAATPDGGGYWLVASDGGIFTFGNARFYGSMGGTRLNQPIVGMAATPDGGGYWMVAADGGIFSFGNAAFYGSTGAMRLNRPIVAMAAAPNGQGYWLVASDGGIFTFGNLGFYGSTGGIALNAESIVGMATTTSSSGYWLVGSRGNIYTFGDAKYYGSVGWLRLASPILAMSVLGG